ncbi:uncharacterized protein LAESUDRAFT_648545 [Laetiporus sulphureus 93-53]|uniref:Uncharacterized protein n=1 Tax=Laetiporus sulphureus 93-53 TaxID=1314785 RepID=A0A165FCQ9_9APHY|nr:uncharacterized protein LAESUDRAFT_648545 [Laetiporus sulphureus 93-53]KZT08771.1 hypothetical protein LAESUDRAFT_648545 [Laetiporus sulphureus 93-53]
MHTHTHPASALSHHRSSTAHAPILCASSTPVCHHHEEAQSTPLNYNLPQCCHCGWRGDHAPTCPFK